MNILSKTLLPGVRLHHLFTDKFKVNHLSMNFLFPLKENRAVYYAMLPDVFRNGCEKYPSMTAFARKCDDLYATEIDASASLLGGTEVFSVSLHTLRNRCTDGEVDLSAEGILLLEEVLFRPRLTEDKKRFLPEITELVRENHLKKLRSIVNNKAAYAMRRCRQEMCKGTPYADGAIGSEEQLAQFSEELFLDCFREMLSKATIEIFYTGDEPVERIEALLSPVISLLGKRNATCSTEGLSYKSCATPVEKIENADTVQGKLCIGYRFNREVSPVAFTAFQAVFSASPVSKLFTNVREKESLCYYCSLTGDVDARIAFVNAGISNKDKTRAIAAIAKELTAVRNMEITDEELEYAQKFLLDFTRQLTDSPIAVQSFLLKLFYRGGITTIEEYRDALLGMTKEDIASVARALDADTLFFLHGNEEGEDSCDEA